MVRLRDCSRRGRTPVLESWSDASQTAEGAEEPRTDIALRASKLIERGFTVLAEHIVNADLIDAARTLTRSRLRELISQAEGANCSFDQHHRLIVDRQMHR